MKPKAILTFMVLFYSCHSFAQFNTLTRASPKKEDRFGKDEIKTEENVEDVDENEGKKRRPFFKFSTKSDLRREIDSLKRLIITHSLSKNESQNLQVSKIEDSSRSMSKNAIRKFELVNDNESEKRSASKIYMPLESRISVTSPYGMRFHPISGTRKMHNGADLKAHYEKVHSVSDGIVTEAGWDSGGGGNYMKVRHSNLFVTSYLHLSEIYYNAGDYVKAGFIIGKSGNSGNSTGPHLHFSVTENGKFINPIRFLNDHIKANNLIATYYEH
jgi:murein DD-endopeptidase MepM/ murein hydrolase activator NlpD